MNKGLIFLSASAFLVASSSVHSEVYIGASVGQTDYGSDFDKGTSYGGFVGYKFNKFLAIEAGYSNYGDTEYDYLPGISFNGKAINLSAVASLPVSEWLDIYAKAGAYKWDASADLGYDLTISTDGTDFGYGAGLNFNLTDSFGLFIEYGRLNSDGEDTSNVSAGLKIFFGGTEHANGGRPRSVSTTNSWQQNTEKRTPGIGSQLRALDSESKNICEFITSITRGAGGPGDAPNYIEKAMDAALTEAKTYGANSYYIVNTDITDSGASVVLEAFKCD